MRKPISKSISEERILKLSNDLSEGIKSGTVEEWRTVARYWRNCHDMTLNKINSVRPSIAALVMGRDMFVMGTAELKTWLAQQCSEDKRL